MPGAVPTIRRDGRSAEITDEFHQRSPLQRDWERYRMQPSGPKDGGRTAVRSKAASLADPLMRRENDDTDFMLSLLMSRLDLILAVIALAALLRAFAWIALH